MVGNGAFVPKLCLCLCVGSASSWETGPALMLQYPMKDRPSYPRAGEGCGCLSTAPRFTHTWCLWRPCGITGPGHYLRSQLQQVHELKDASSSLPASRKYFFTQFCKTTFCRFLIWVTLYNFFSGYHGRSQMYISLLFLYFIRDFVLKLTFQTLILTWRLYYKKTFPLLSFSINTYGDFSKSFTVLVCFI